MIRVNIREAMTHLTKYLERAEKKGEPIVLCRRNVPIAEIRPLPKVAAKRRPLGLGTGTVTIPPSFFDPLPDDIIEEFEGKD